MSLLPITLGVKRNIDAQSGSSRKRKPLSRQQISKLLDHTLEKDDYTCRYCGFQSRQFQKAIPKDWAVNDPRDSELVTACLFCEQCFALDTVSGMGSGALAWLPDMPQATLNNLARAVYAVKHMDKAPAPLKLAAERAADIFAHARGEAKRRLGTDDPAVLSSVLLEHLGNDTYQKRNAKLDGIRLLPLDRRVQPTPNGPDSDQFPRIVAYWTSPEGPFGALDLGKLLGAP